MSLLSIPLTRNTFDTPGELSAQLACSPYAACVGDDVPLANIGSMDLPYRVFESFEDNAAQE